MNNTPNWSLRIAVALPLLMIAAIALSIYVPKRLQHFRGQFVYAVPGSYSYGSYGVYSVVQGKLRANLPSLPGVSSATVRAPIVYPPLYVHDLATNTSHEVSFAEAQALMLDSSSHSPDGIDIVPGNHADGIFPLFLFSSPDYTTMYAQGPHGSLKLNLWAQSPSYYMPIQFLGWAKS